MPFVGRSNSPGVARELIENVSIVVERDAKFPSEWFATHKGKPPIPKKI